MVKRIFQCVVVVLGVWLTVLALMGWNLFVVVSESSQSTDALKKTLMEMDTLKTQNAKLKALVADLQSSKEKLRTDSEHMKKKLETKLKRYKKSIGSFETTAPSTVKNHTLMQIRELSPAGFMPPSLDFVKIRRRAEKEVREMWYYLSAEFTKVSKNYTPEHKRELFRILDEFTEMHNALTNNFEVLNDMDGNLEWRSKEHAKLSDMFQKRIYNLQNPKDCKTARKLICQLNKGCGYGCQMHHIQYCFIVAYGLGRTLIIDSTGWRYNSKGWESVFQTPSNSCTKYEGTVEPWIGENSQATNVLLPIVDSLYPRPKYMPLAVPEDLVQDIYRISNNPFVWFLGQFAKYLFRYNKEMQDMITKWKEKVGFRGPVVGVQVRRTDKITTGEAVSHSIEEYMYWVDLYFRRKEKVMKIDKRRVFLATDDPTLLKEARKKYPEYDFISDNKISKSAGLQSRYTETSLQGLIIDIQLLSESDYLVCTFSSQVCRMAYEIMHGRDPDASDKFQSLDDIYYFGGQTGHHWRVIYPHQASKDDELDLEVGDYIGIAGNHWDGYAKGTSKRTGKVGLFPAYKAEDVLQTAKFPEYEDSL